MLLIPSINGQISPQIFYALSHCCLPVVDCFAAFQTSQYHRNLLTILGSLDQVVTSLCLPQCLGISDFILLCKHLKNLAHSELSFVRLYLSSNPCLRELFTLQLSFDLVPSVPSTSSSSSSIALRDLSSQSILSRLDQIKLLSLRDPFLLHQAPLDQATLALAESVHNSVLQESIALSLQLINESRLWMYHV